MYPVGLLMGLGFDTATQVALLVLAGGTAALSLPWYAILVLPVLFAAGMTLFDTADGALMAHAYRWAYVQPERKVAYNLVVPTLSVVAALGMATVVLWGFVEERRGGLTSAIGAVDTTYVGYLLVVLLLTTWAVGVAVWRRRHPRGSGPRAAGHAPDES